MNQFDDVVALSLLPVVNLDDISEPRGGQIVALNSSCQRNFKKDQVCQKHYQALAQSNSCELVQCPHGFSSIKVAVGNVKTVLTGIIPYPRIGGTQERIKARQHPEVKITRDSVTRVISSLKSTHERLIALQTETVKNQSMALHEIRKLNRTVKQTAERMNEKDRSQESLLILKTSELMSKQFDVIEILANESLTRLALNSTTEVYRIFDKCVHIFQTPDQRIKLIGDYNYKPKVLVCDKTFPIIPTVLIENALKYAVAGSEIKINVQPAANECEVAVSNVASLSKELGESIFERGVRASTDGEGSGNGLYVAQLVARQHRSTITVGCLQGEAGKMLCTFRIRLGTL